MADIADQGMVIREETRPEEESSRQLHKWETVEFRVTLYLTYWIFLFGAILMRFSGTRPRILLSPDGEKKPRRSVFGEAWEMATASIAFAFASR